jgi:hypothetical protein|tara:strand:- start:8 stop:616 length:609 start_codon:yes stop_codon:yes gene_type:complete
MTSITGSYGLFNPVVINLEDRIPGEKRPHMKTTYEEIIDWGMRNIDECGFKCFDSKDYKKEGRTLSYPVDASEMDTHCWRCGYDGNIPIQKCHVIPWALGGPDIPANYRLLCEWCHDEGPNVKDYDAMDIWIRESAQIAGGKYNRYWKVRDMYSNVLQETSMHFGHKDITQSSKEWAVKETFKRLHKLDMIELNHLKPRVHF